ncbi:MAG: phytoene/squalene synthase family protein [Flavobacteriales bacterium]|nr:phytoene/squalene synthase family protein [Flavobacteriales bacterium]MDG1781097.1 phytoene/squalene synthase family protein [Flavobacteriales bacterium]MDG2246528.1 phytoene/squalene synthase family protein [Flavobacteriales bacterium]
MKELFDDVSLACSVKTTKSYSTSFSMGIRFLDKQFRDPIYSVYGFVRFADEIVDTFHDYDKEKLLNKFEEDTWAAIEDKISLNPILNSFQWAYHKFNIDKEHVVTFLKSMRMDLDKSYYDREGYEDYILGSAEVVGLMCLRIFVEGDDTSYNHLKPYAKSLGAAFQKINFLRDLHADYLDLGRAYFPGLEVDKFDEKTKQAIEAEIEADFKKAYIGIVQLPKKARLGVYVAYVYYYRLFVKIKNLPSNRILEERIRIPNQRKVALFVGSYVKHSFNLI